ncbi:GNAT family N-acetyltransferase [Nesterenkonia sandarakina]|uniref:GNAT superfamily N-acetyltransferase n=1 Tax=Nesterenkonia sandarakina TaxID=272918 RepID=A0A7Z0E7W1_9MICC|nr:GNAT family N-acetyltransferase [Nesterenkonia sandarakina]NYJ16721.1 GNAT superfamily N-acetyltransferase [Nesterenkonia sandarakina]
MAVVIRRPRPEDAERIAAVHVATWRETYINLLPEGFSTEEHSRMRRETWTRILTEQKDEWSIRVAEVDGEIIGFAMAGPAQDAAESPDLPSRTLYTLYVLRNQHGTGAGQALLDSTLGAGSGTGSDTDVGAAPGAEVGAEVGAGTGNGSGTEAGAGAGAGAEAEAGAAPFEGVRAEPVSLWVARQNPRAIAFYLRNGFRFDGSEQQDPGAPAITDARMVRP